MKHSLSASLLLLAALATSPAQPVQAQARPVKATSAPVPTFLRNDMTAVRNFTETAEIWRTTPQLPAVREHQLVRAYFAEYRRLSSIVQQAYQAARHNPRQLQRWQSFADALERSWDPLEALRVQQLRSTAEALPALRKGYQAITVLRQKTEAQLSQLEPANSQL